MILKPFMLRRVKKDVENELSDKVPFICANLSFFAALDQERFETCAVSFFHSIDRPIRCTLRLCFIVVD